MRWLGFGIVFLFAISGSAFSHAKKCRQSITRHLSAAWVDKMIRESSEVEPAQRRIREAAQQTDLSVLARNGDILKNHNDHYSVVVRRGEIADQENSGRCWIFAGLSMLRAGLIGNQLVPANFRLSASYLHFFGYLEQANAHLERIIDWRNRDFLDPKKRSYLSPTRVSEGGYFGDFIHLIEKYGLVPESVMPDTEAARNTTAWLEPELQNLLGRISQELIDRINLYRGRSRKDEFPEEKINELLEIKARGLRATWKLLTLFLGVPPTDFEFRFGVRLPDEDKKWKVAKVKSRTKTFDPKTFASEVLGFDPHNYVEIDYNPRFEFGKVYEIKNTAIGIGSEAFPARNRLILNLPIERLMSIAMKSLDKGHPVWFAADVWKDVDHQSGIMHPEIFDRSGLFGWTKEEDFGSLRPLTAVQFKLLFPGHAMLISGYDKPRGKGLIKFRVENSWGNEVGDSGIYHLYKEWFSAYVFEIATLRRYLSPKERAAFDSEPIVLKQSEWQL